MNEAAIYEALTEIFAEIFMRDVLLTPELAAKDVKGWDSFRQIEIIVAAEEHFGIKFNTRELDNLQKVGDLVSFIVRKIDIKK